MPQSPGDMRRQLRHAAGCTMYRFTDYRLTITDLPIKLFID